jgi:hypothetical protein
MTLGFTGQTLKQAPQPMHLDSSTEGCDIDLFSIEVGYLKETFWVASSIGQSLSLFEPGLWFKKRGERL